MHDGIGGASTEESLVGTRLKPFYRLCHYHSADSVPDNEAIYARSTGPKHELEQLLLDAKMMEEQLKTAMSAIQMALKSLTLICKAFNEVVTPVSNIGAPGIRSQRKEFSDA